MKSDLKPKTKDVDRGAGAATLSGAIVMRAERARARPSTDKPGDITQALADLHRDPTVAARPSPANVEPSAPKVVPLPAPPAPSEHSPVDDYDAKGFAGPLQRVLKRLRGQGQRSRPKSDPEAPAAIEPTPDVEQARSMPEPQTTTELTPDRPPDPESPKDILDHWHDLRHGRTLPSWSDLDARRIATCWPNSLLMRYLAEGDRLQLESSFADRLRNNRPTDVEVEAIDYSPMVTEWVIGIARAAIELGQPAEDTEEFPSTEEPVRYHVVALPLSDDQSDIDHVLCHVSLA